MRCYAMRAAMTDGCVFVSVCSEFRASDEPIMRKKLFVIGNS